MRVASLDLIRGIAVLGILAINIAGFAGPSIGTLTPNLPAMAGPLDNAAFAFNYVVFEGKMRALFAIMFGASMALFIDRADAQGRDGDRLQARRLGWLLLFGLLHYVLLWWGDILFAYAACGLVLLMLHRLPDRLIAAGAVALFIVSHLEGLHAALGMISAEDAVRLGHATAEQASAYGRYRSAVAATINAELGQYTGGFMHILNTKLREHPFWPLVGVHEGFGEYLPLMTLGLVLQRRGFFSGEWSRRAHLALAIGCGAIGLVLTLASLAWLWPRQFPVAAMDASLRYGMALPHALLAWAYAGLLVLAAPRLSQTALSRRLAAAGRMAFSNYLATSLVMTAIFYGWGLGLFGRFGPLSQWGFVLLGWTLMLAWSAPWLSRWKRGPLEWLWRSATEWRWLPNNR